MTSSEKLRFEPGAVLELAERDYIYGVGTLALRIGRLAVDPAHYPAIEWVNAEAAELYANGDVSEPRLVTIRVTAIEAALRPKDWLPPPYPAPRQMSHRARP